MNREFKRMAQDLDPGIAHLMALKGAAGAPRHEEPRPSNKKSDSSSGDPSSGERFSIRDKRRSRRYKCEGSAEIRAEGAEIRTWASFTDISLHGCYVEAQSTYPAGALLHVKLDANGIHVETQGIVRVSYPYLGMGIAFADLTPHNTAELRSLLAGVLRADAILRPGVASSLPWASADTATAVADPRATLQALTEFFESRETLTREDFLRIVKKSQK
jgi:hypothetical protein